MLSLHIIHLIANCLTLVRLCLREVDLNTDWLSHNLLDHM